MKSGRRILAWLGAYSLLCCAPALASDVSVLHAGWLLAIPGQPPLLRQSVLVEGDRIVAVHDGFLEGGDPRLPAEATVVDLSRSFVLPGLIDAHVHLASAPGKAAAHAPMTATEGELALLAGRHATLTLQAGFTTVVDLGAVGIPGHENAIFAVRDAVRDGQLAGPAIIAAGTPIAATGQERAPTLRGELGATVDRRSVCDGQADCRRAVRHQVRRGADIIVFFNTGSLLADDPVAQSMTEAEMRAIVDTAHALGRKAIADGHHAKGIAAANRAGADSLDSLHLYDADTFTTLRDDVFVQSHIHGVLQAVGDTPETLGDGLWGWLPLPLLQRFQAIRQRPFAVIAAWRAGIRNVAYASDAGVYRWGENAADLVEFVRRGIPPQDALKIATMNTARMLGLDGRLGSIEAGKQADIIATESDPLADISTMLHVHFVMREGVVFRSGGKASRQVITKHPAVAAGESEESI